MIAGTDRLWSYSEVRMTQAAEQNLMKEKKNFILGQNSSPIQGTNFYSCALLSTLLIISWLEHASGIVPRRASCSPNSFEMLSFEF